MWPLRVLLLTSANFSKDYHLSRSAWNLFPSSLKGSHSQCLIAVRRYKSLAKVPVSCFRICARGLIYSSFSFMLQRLPNNYTQAGLHLKTILTVLFVFSLKCSPDKSLAQGGNISLFIILHFITLHKYCIFFYKLKICGTEQFYQHCFSNSICSPDLSVPHFSTSHNIAHFLLLFCLLQRSMIRDHWCICCKKIMTSWWFRW